MCCNSVLRNDYFSCFSVSAVLEHEAIAGLSAGKPSGLRGRALMANSSQPRGSVTDEKNSDLSLDQLIKAVCSILRQLHLIASHNRISHCLQNGNLFLVYMMILCHY